VGTPSLGAINDILELGTISLGFANSLSQITPVPQSCRAAHDQLVSRALAFYDILRAITSVQSNAQFFAWLATYDRRFDEFDDAFTNWLNVTGIRLPTLGGLR